MSIDLKKAFHKVVRKLRNCAVFRFGTSDVKFSRMILGENIPENILRLENFLEFSVSVSQNT
jgi:hypothetical protein